MADEPMRTTNPPTQTPPQTPGQAPAQALRDFPVDLSQISTVYANFARVTGTPEELILDFGLNTQVVPNPTEAVKITHRLVVNYFTAKRLLHALNHAVRQHEQMYGMLEIDIQKRMLGQMRP